MEPTLDWAEHLTLPIRFSKETADAIESGVLTRKTRIEIHNSLATLILVHTCRPTSNDRKIVCRRLIEKYPSLRDSSPSGYVSIFVSFLYIILLLFKVFLQLLLHIPLT